jgi:type IV secretion system protein VirB4
MSASTKNKKNTNIEILRDISGDVTESDFVPFSVHYDPHTVITKNGELLQTIKITGFSHEDIESEEVSLRGAIRKAIQDSIHSTDYAIWFHTIRRKKNIAPRGIFKKDFAGYLNTCWRDRNHFETGFINEVYITIVKEGEASPLFNPKNFIRELIPAIDSKKRFAFLEKAHAELEGTVLSMLEVLEEYGAKRLGVVEKDGVYYSQLCSFLGKLTTLTDHPWPLPDIEISKYLTDYDVTFGYNAMEVRNSDGARRFGAILTLKEYKELNLHALDKFLQLPCEFIVTQCIDFINHKKALKDYEYQDYIFKVSKQSEMKEKIGLKDILDSNRDSPVDYGEQQLNIFLIADTIKNLEERMKIASESLSEIGIISMREDIKMEETYWSMLPANFEFLKRLKPINTSRVGGFANLSNFPAGQNDNNHWGPAVTLFYTSRQTPYYFNFHNDDNGHTSIIGPFGAGKTVLLNFLVSEARKFDSRLYYFDQSRASEIFIRSIGGTYHLLGSDKNALKLNPLQIEDTEENRSFLVVWLESLISKVDESSDHKETFEACIEHLYSLPTTSRNLSSVVAYMQNINLELATRFEAWSEGGVYEHIFSKDTDTLDLSKRVKGFDLTPIISNPDLMIPVFSYLIHRITISMDGEPLILVMDEAWKLLDNVWFAPRLDEWLDALKENNAMVIFATENVGEALHSPISPILIDHIATQIYLPDPEVRDEYQSVFNLTDLEASYVYSMKSQSRQFLLKHGNDTIVATLNLKGMEDILSVLSSTPESIEKMNRCIVNKGQEIHKWLPDFLKNT